MKKTILLPILSMIFVFMMAGIGNAAVSCTFDQTETTVGTRSTYIDGTAFNISATLSDPVDEGDNLTAGILSNDITSTTYVFNSSGGTTNVSQVNASVDTAEFLDTQSVTFTWTLKNLSQDTITTCTGSYIADNTVPGCAFASTLTSNEVYAPTQLWSVTCNNASSATLQFGSNTLKTMTETSDTCTYTGDKSSVPQGTYSLLQAITNDGLNTTSCSLSSIRIDIGVPLKEIAAIAASGAQIKGAEPASSSDNKQLATVLIILVAGIWLYRYRKKK